MLRDLWSYTKQSFQISWKPAWRGGESPIWDIVIALMSLALARFLSPWIQSRFQEEDVQDLIMWRIAFFVAILCFFLLRLIFVAPFQLYRKQKKEVEVLQSNLQEKQKQLNDLVYGDTPDLPFGDAITLVRQLSSDGRAPDEEIAKQVVQMLFREKISAWGQAPLLNSMVPLADTPVKIPHQFFFDPIHSPTEDNGYVFEIHNSLGGWANYRDHEKYLNVMVNRGQVNAAFASKSPM